MRHHNNISGLLGAPRGLLVVRQLEENVFGGAYPAFLVIPVSAPCSVSEIIPKI